METKDIILELRTKKGLSQEELAEKIFVTRQAVSRWENGETIPNTETLKLLSKLFDVSINTLLGSPRELICQCCGMPLEDSTISKEKDGIFNEEYCKWCYADGEYMYHDMDDLIDVCVGHMANEQFTPEQVRAYMKNMLPKLDYWKKYKYLGGAEKFEEFKQQLISEFNDLHIDGMPKVEKLNALVGGYINLEYRLPNGQTVKFLDDNATYLGNQLECEFGGERCFGIAANMDFLLVCTYEENGENPELVVYKKRQKNQKLQRIDKMQYNIEFWNALDELVNNSEIIIDRPKGTAHPKYPDFIYRVDYGYLKDTSSMDGAGIDVWVGSSEKKVDAIMCIVDLMKKDSEIKILIGCTEEEKKIVYETHNETQFMKGVLIRR